MGRGSRRRRGWWRRSSPRVRFAIALIISVLLGWPASSIALALGIPLFEQTMLALSWLAPAFTAIDLLFTAQVHEQQEERDGRKE
jgi:hypothetical protein